ncbi:sulfotransferase 6B1-like [Aplochiton taeniatus]
MTKLPDAKNVKDEDKLYKYEGILYSSILSPTENLNALKNLEARPEDVLLVAYPKCGFNWMVAVLRKIIDAAIGLKEKIKMPPLIEFFSPDIQKGLTDAPSPRLLGTHFHRDNIPASFITKKTKVLVVFRNPKDTVVSYYHFTNNNPFLPTAKSWDSFFADFMSGEVAWGSYFDHALAWDKHMDDPNVMIVTFEELKEVIFLGSMTKYLLNLFSQDAISNLADGVRQISTFFGFELTNEEIQSIADESTFNVMKERSKDTLGHMSNVIFRKGDIGDWKNHFNDAQSKEMDKEFQKHLADTKLGAKLNYDVYCK